MPALYHWRGTFSDAATNPFNWYRPGGDMTPPGADDHVYFDQSAPNCVGLGGSVEGVHVYSQYGGTVELAGSLTTRVLDLFGAAIKQPASTNLTITETFFWTGGTLNSNNQLATVRMQGATATIAPSGGTLTTGSDLNFEAGVSGLVKEGTVNLTNFSTLFVDSLSTLLADTTIGNVNFTQPNQPPTPRAAKIDGTMTIDGGKTTFLPVGVQVTGTLRIQKGSKLDVNSGTIASVETTGNAGVISIENGSTVKVSKGVWLMSGGALRTTVLPPNPDQRGTPAIIDGDFYIFGGSVTLGSDSNPHIWSALKVTGKGEWVGGVINITIHNNAGLNQLDQLTFDGTFMSQVQLVNGQPAPNAPRFAISSVLPPANNQVWREVLKAAGGITAAGPLPSAGTGFTIAAQAPVNGKVLAWDIQS